MASWEAIAQDGPVGGDPGLRVPQSDDGEWPQKVLWTTGPDDDERHLYVFKAVSMGPTHGIPEYGFDHTLDSGEDDPT